MRAKKEGHWTSRYSFSLFGMVNKSKSERKVNARSLANPFHALGPSIKYVCKIFRKTNISNLLIRTRTCAYQGWEMLVFRKILRTYLMDDPFGVFTYSLKTTNSQQSFDVFRCYRKKSVAWNGLSYVTTSKLNICIILSSRFFQLYFRSSHRNCSLKKGIIEIVAKFTGKHLWQSLLFNKVTDAACNFFKKESLAHLFSCEFCGLHPRDCFCLLFLGLISTFAQISLWYCCLSRPYPTLVTEEQILIISVNI